MYSDWTIRKDRGKMGEKGRGNRGKRERGKRGRRDRGKRGKERKEQEREGREGERDVKRRTWLNCESPEKEKEVRTEEIALGTQNKRAKTITKKEIHKEMPDESAGGCTMIQLGGL